MNKFACTFRIDGGSDGIGLYFETGRGYDQYQTSADGTVVTPLTIAGFRAYAVADRQLDACTVGVDIADSQTLATTANGTAAESTEALCDRANQFASAAITALTSQ